MKEAQTILVAFGEVHIVPFRAPHNATIQNDAKNRQSATIRPTADLSLNRVPCNLPSNHSKEWTTVAMIVQNDSRLYGSISMSTLKQQLSACCLGV